MFMERLSDNIRTREALFLVLRDCALLRSLGGCPGFSPATEEPTLHQEQQVAEKEI